MEFVLIAIAILVVGLVAGIGLLVSAGRRTTRLDDDAATGTTLTRPRPDGTGTEIRIVDPERSRARLPAPGTIHLEDATGEGRRPRPGRCPGRR